MVHLRFWRDTTNKKWGVSWGSVRHPKLIPPKYFGDLVGISFGDLWRGEGKLGCVRDVGADTMSHQSHTWLIPNTSMPIEYHLALSHVTKTLIPSLK
eukprot:scaffold2092_cov155-Skeletonema_dohrnii-CCMP3373.AAC.1